MMKARSDVGGAGPGRERAAPSASLAGQHAVVTGASRGIGAAIATSLAQAGASLTLIARGRNEIGQVAARLAADHGVAARGLSADATDEAALAEALQQAVREGGAPSILVNNAGGTESLPFVKETRAHWEATMALNLTSTFLCTRALLPGMLEAGYGRIVNVASTAGLKGYAYVAAYCAAKHAVIGLTRALALETARKGITVNAVCPGYTDTPMVAGAIETIVQKTGRSRDDAAAALTAVNPQGRLVEPAEVAASVLWLVQPSSGAITGQSIAVAGGEVM